MHCICWIVIGLGLFMFFQPSMAGKFVRAAVVAPLVITTTITPQKYDYIIEEYHW